MGIPVQPSIGSTHFTIMKLIAGISTLVGLAVAGPSGRSGVPISPVWMKSFVTPEDSFGRGSFYYTLTETEIPNAGSIAWNTCGDVSGMFGEPYCPNTWEEAEEVYSNLLVEHFMPLSKAAGEFVDEEVDNIVTFALGGRALEYDGRPVPSPTIDHTGLAINDGSANDVYRCGLDAYGGLAMDQWSEWAVPTPNPPGWADATAPDTKPCLNLGGHQGFNDTWAPFTMKNMLCTTSMYVCKDVQQTSNTHDGQVVVVEKDMTTLNIEIAKAAFNAAYNSEYALPTEATVPVVVTEPVTETPVAAGSNNMMMIIGVLVVIAIVVAVVVMKK